MISLPFSERDFLYIIYGKHLDATNVPAKNRYYQNLYERWQSGERIIWNWGAFFTTFAGLGGVWMIYRRLYLLSFVYHLITVLIFSTSIKFLAEQSMDAFKVSIFTINLALAILSGLFANTLQLTWLSAWIKKFPKHKIPCGSDIKTIFAYFLIILVSLSNTHEKLSGIITVILFGLFVFSHFIYYEYDN